MSDTVFLYVTAPDSDEARRIGRDLVEKKLAACANIIGGSVSIYEWDGAIEQTAEATMIVKTSAERAGAARDRIVALHPYDTPCIASISIDTTASHKPFLDWIAKTTKA